MEWKIPLFKIYWDEQDVNSVSEVIRSGMRWTNGQEVIQFEEALADYIGVKYCVVFNSGTSALHANMLALGLRPNDEIIVPSFTFIATANAPLFVDAKPVFADIEMETYGLDPHSVVNKITDRTKGIMPIHYGGLPCNIQTLRDLAADHDLILIEDAAEALGAQVSGKKAGTFGKSALLSFCQNKIITTGEGGAIVTDSEDVYRKLKLIRSHGRVESQDFFSTTDYLDYVTLGYNFRMPSINAALGLSQLEKIDTIIEKRRAIAAYYNTELHALSTEKNGIKTIQDDSERFHVYQLYNFQLSSTLRDPLQHFLTQQGIMTKIYFDPVHLTKFYRTKHGYKEGDLPVTEQASKSVLALPIYPSMTEDEQTYVIDSIKQFFEG